MIGLKKSYFPLIRLPSCYRTVCYWIVYWTVCYRTLKWANHIQRCSLKQPITFKVVITCACARAFVFLQVTLECLRLLCQNFNPNFPLFSWLSYFSFPRKLQFLWSIDNRTSCRPIQSVTILLISKSDSRAILLSLVWLQSYYHYLLVTAATGQVAFCSYARFVYASYANWALASVGRHLVDCTPVRRKILKPTPKIFGVT